MNKNANHITPNFETLSPQNYILIKGAKVNNLKNIDVAVPRNQLVVITGVSGSGKSSLMIDTLYAEGQRRYVESLSSYARQFLGRLNKPEVEYIKGICPAIAIEQKTQSNRNMRSTVGTLTEIYDFLRLLYARIGTTFSPISNTAVKKHQVADVTHFIWQLPPNTRLYILAPFKEEKALLQKEPKQVFEMLTQKGFSRVLIDNQLFKIEELDYSTPFYQKNICIVIDRISTTQSPDADTQNRCADSVQTAFYESNGECLIQTLENENTEPQTYFFSNRLEADGMVFEEPAPHFFNYNSPFGACKECEGFGNAIAIDPNLVMPNHNLSVFEDAIVCWKGEKMSLYKNELIQNAHLFDFPIHRPIKQLTPKEYEVLWVGNNFFTGLNSFFNYLETNSLTKMHYRIILSKYKGKTTCPNCQGARLRLETNYVKIQNTPIAQLLNLPIGELKTWFQNLTLNPHQQTIADRPLYEINSRLQIMCNIGLEYLTLNRSASTLSGGETQRINLTRLLGSNLTNSMYILDEPSIGLHPRDTQQLIQVLKKLRDLGNTVIIIEHEEEVMLQADYLIDVGPAAGHIGGEIVFAGTIPQLHTPDNKSLTAQYLTHKLKIEVPTFRRKVVNFLEIKECTQHNLKNIDVKFPLNLLTVVTGVSGSGKSTLVKKILFPLLQKHFEPNSTEVAGKHTYFGGDVQLLSAVEMIDQNPLGRSSRSNAVTYTKAYDTIREVFSKQPAAKVRGLEPSHFSFNVKGGRCETCEGEGEMLVEMQFLADVRLTCEDCNGQRFKNEVLQVTYLQKNISEVLQLTVNEAIAFFEKEKDIVQKLQPLQDVGLGYIKLGQSSSTLSGGEAQRLKLATYLGKGKKQQPILFIFDEPSTGLHFNDIKKLLYAFNALVENGHTVIVVEHNTDIIKCADWVIDLGVKGGNEGGYLLYEGTPEGLLKCKKSVTAPFLKQKMG